MTECAAIQSVVIYKTGFQLMKNGHPYLRY